MYNITSCVTRCGLTQNKKWQGHKTIQTVKAPKSLQGYGQIQILVFGLELAIIIMKCIYNDIYSNTDKDKHARVLGIF